MTDAPSREQLINAVSHKLAGHSFALITGGHHEEVASKLVDFLTERLAAKPADEGVIPESATLGSSIDLLVGISFNRVETLDPARKHRYYRECGCCGGTDKDRDHYKPDISKVVHINDCPLARDLPILKAIGLASDARHRVLSTTGKPKP